MLVSTGMLPDLDGLEMLRLLRARGVPTPAVLMLTALGSVDIRVQGLDAGADDYLAKPFAFSELLARMGRSLGARRPRRRPASRSTTSSSTQDRATWCASARVRCDLSAREFALLAYLIRNAGRVLTRQQILVRRLGAEPDVYSNVVDLYVRTCPQKLAELDRDAAAADDPRRRLLARRARDRECGDRRGIAAGHRAGPSRRAAPPIRSAPDHRRLLGVTLGLVGTLVLSMGAAWAFVALRALDQDLDQALEKAATATLARLGGESRTGDGSPAGRNGRRRVTSRGEGRRRRRGSHDRRPHGAAAHRPAQRVGPAAAPKASVRPTRCRGRTRSS